jgi:hypothetical protein
MAGDSENLRERWEVTGDWRKQHNEELHYLYCSPDIIIVRV